MQIIEKIEIIWFRSFLWSPKEYSVEILDLRDLNIFSWSNDSWKSNILRALNLFFNRQTDFWKDYMFSRDLSRSKKGSGNEVIRITLHFNLSKEQSPNNFLPRKFAITRFFDKYGYRNDIYTFKLKSIEDKEIKISSIVDDNSKVEKELEELLNKAKTPREVTYRRQFAWFLDSIHFEYVPAIRGASYFTHLFGRLILSLKDEQVANRVNVKMEELETTINEELNTLISSIWFLDSSFKIGDNLKDFFESFDISTGWSDWISFRSRWDWIQAKYIPFFLDFLSKKSSKKFTIWWFEEPENSAEYKNQQDFAKNLKDSFIDSKQVFITTHSEEFLQLYDGKDIDQKNRRANLYHVKQFPDKDIHYSKVFLFNVDKNDFEFANQKVDLEWDLWQSFWRAKHSKDIKKMEDKFLEDTRKLEDDNKELERILKTQNYIVLTEWKYDYEILSLAWRNLYWKKKMPFYIEARVCAHTVSIDIDWKCKMKDFDKKIIWIFDHDTEWYRCWNWLQEFDPRDNILKKSKYNETYWLLLPVPNISWRGVYINCKNSDKRLETEHYFDDSVLSEFLQGNYTNRRQCNWIDYPIYEVEDKKSFFEFISKDRDATIDFSAFKILFKKIADIFQISL